MRRWLATHMRDWADLIDRTSGPRFFGAGTVTLRPYVGWVFHYEEQQRGLRLWYMAEDYAEAVYDGNDFRDIPGGMALDPKKIVR